MVSGSLFQHLFFLTEVATQQLDRLIAKNKNLVSTPFLPNRSRYKHQQNIELAFWLFLWFQHLFFLTEVATPLLYNPDAAISPDAVCEAHKNHPLKPKIPPVPNRQNPYPEQQRAFQQQNQHSSHFPSASQPSTINFSKL